MEGRKRLFGDLSEEVPAGAFGFLKYVFGDCLTVFTEKSSQLYLAMEKMLL